MGIAKQKYYNEGASSCQVYLSVFFLHSINIGTHYHDHPRCIDKGVGGFFQNFRDDGSVYDSKTRHPVLKCDGRKRVIIESI